MPTPSVSDGTPARRTRAKGNGLAGSPRTLRIAVLGTGYVGLVTAACLARFGHHVGAIDIDTARIDGLSRGEMPIHETGLGELVREQADAGRLRFSADTQALADAELVFVSVGTPARHDGSTAMEAVDRVTLQIGRLVRAPAVVVIRSTVPVGTARRMRAALIEAVGDAALAPQVLSDPAFLREGSAIADFMAPSRIILGSDANDGVDPATTLLQAYAPLLAENVPVLTMDTRSAELAKCAANAMLAMRISFVNEIAAIAAATGADIERVVEGIGSDARIGPQGLRAGLGYGGTCFPKDVAALRHTARIHGLRSDVLYATERVNGRQRSWPFEALQRDLGRSSALRGMRAAIWGLSFKPGTDNMNEAPSLALIERLCRAGVFVNLYDPVAMDNARALVRPDRRVQWCDSAMAAADDVDVLLLVTEWPEFLELAPERVAPSLRLRTVYDGRNALDLGRWTAAGLRVVQVGRPDSGKRPPRSERGSPVEANGSRAVSVAGG